MTVETRPQEQNPQDITDISQVGCTRVASCAIGNYTSPLMQQNLRAKLERERRELEKRQQISFSSSFRDLFG